MKKNQFIKWSIFPATAILVLLFFSSRTSPLYSLLLGDYGNNTASAAMTIGKCWANKTAIPYRDLFSMGGPLYFVLQAFGWFISDRTGIFLLEVLSFTVFLGFTAHLTNRYTNKKVVILNTIISIIVYIALCAGGNSTFEWCLPFIACGYHLIFFQKQPYSNGTSLLLGFLGGCVLLIDFRAGGLLYGVIIWFIFCSPQSSRYILWKRLIWCLSGIILPVLFAISIFTIYGALPEMIQGTFLYPAHALLSGFDNLQVILHKGIKCCLLLPMLIGGILSCQKKWDSLGTCMIFSTIACGALLLCGDNRWYYFLAALPSIPLGIMQLYPRKKQYHLFIIESFSCLLIIALSATPFKNFVSFLKEGVAEVIDEFYEDAMYYKEQNPDFHCITIDTDYSYFLMLDKEPEHKYFTNQTELCLYDSSIKEKVEKYISDGQADLVFLTERGYIGRNLENYTLTQVYLKYGGSLFVYIHNK